MYHPRYFYIGLFVLVALVGTAFFVYRTSMPPTESAVQVPTAEFGGVSLRIDYATTTTARERGLGGLDNIPNDYGMLFVFAKDDYYSIWMKDMLVPIDIFWLDSKGHVISIARDVATSTFPNVFHPTEPARYVLETAAGFAQEHSIMIGTPLLLKNLPIVSE